MTLRALVVDDEPVARRRLRALLKSEPRVEIVGECEDGYAALDAIRRLGPDLMFLDVQMPGIDGFELLRALPATQIPLTIFVTAYDQYALAAFAASALDYLLKPVDDARLDESLDRSSIAVPPARHSFDRGDRPGVELAEGRNVRGIDDGCAALLQLGNRRVRQPIGGGVGADGDAGAHDEAQDRPGLQRLELRPVRRDPLPARPQAAPTPMSWPVPPCGRTVCR